MNFNYLFNNTFSTNLAIDFGSQTTSIYVYGKGLVLKEASYIAYDTRTSEVYATGNEAKQMLGRAPKCIKVVKPIDNGLITEYEMASKLISVFLGSVLDKTLLKPRIIASVPQNSTIVEQRAIDRLLKEVGAREVFLIPTPLAAASGAGCDISLARGLLVADIGSAKCDIASISLGSIVAKNTVSFSDNTFDDVIIKYVREHHGLIIGQLSAEAIKHEIGCVYPYELSKNTTVSGIDAKSSLPRTISINSEEIRDIYAPIIHNIAQAIKDVLLDNPPELISDIYEDGMLLTGGNSKLYGIDKFLQNEIGIKIFVNENPQDCVVRGASMEFLKLDDLNSNKFCYDVYSL